MKWNKRKKTEKKEPQLGDFKRRVRFALFPVKIGDEVVWWEKYIKVWKYRTEYRFQDHVVSSGLLEDVFTTTGLLNERGYRSMESYDTWSYHSRELLPLIKP